MPGPSVVTNSPVPLLCYEQLLDHAVPGLDGFRWPKLDEGTPCGLCYTSGTTGNPKVCLGGGGDCMLVCGLSVAGVLAFSLRTWMYAHMCVHSKQLSVLLS